MDMDAVKATMADRESALGRRRLRDYAGRMDRAVEMIRECTRAL